MSAASIAFLAWVRGPGFHIALGLFCLGLVWRLIEIYALGRDRPLAPLRRRSGASGWWTILRRSRPSAEHESMVSYLAGYTFHIGLIVTFFFFTPHIELLRRAVGLSWPSLPTALVDGLAVVTLLALGVMLASRLLDPVKRFLSVAEDYVAWGLTLAPVLTGYLCFHHLLLPYTTMLALHLASVEVLMVLMPFTKLIHFVTLFPSRWMNGEHFGRTGVAA